MICLSPLYLHRLLQNVRKNEWPGRNAPAGLRRIRHRHAAIFSERHLTLSIPAVIDDD